MTPEEVGTFLAARQAASRGECDRWLKSRGVDRGNAAAYAATRREYSALPLLLDPTLERLAWRAVATARAQALSGSEPFPSMVWYGGATDTFGGHRFKGTIADFVEHVLAARSREVAPKRCGWVVTPTSNVDGHRTNASTVAVHALNLDADGTGEWHHLLEVLEELDLAAILYQSGGWSPSTPKWHALLPLARPWSTSTIDGADEWKAAYHTARVVLGALARLPGEGFDPTVEAPSVPVFVTEKRSADAPPRQVVWRPGHALDLDALVGALPPIPTDAPRAASPLRAAEIEPLDDARLEEIVEALCGPMQHILSGRRDLYLCLPGELLHRGVAQDDVRAIVEAVSDRCPGDPEYSAREVDDRHREHLHCCETTIARHERGGLYTRGGVLADRWPEVAVALDSVVEDPEVRRGREICRRMRERAEARKTTVAGEATPKRRASSVNLDDLVAQLRQLRRKKKCSPDFDDKIRGEVLDALLRRRDLSLYDGERPVVDSRGVAFDRRGALKVAMWMVGSKLPLGTEFEDIAEIVRPSVCAMLGEGEAADDLMAWAERCFLAAVGRKGDAEERVATRKRAGRDRRREEMFAR